ncbi:cell division protein DivIVA [Bifidobacterium pseudolongum]|uniref:Dihydrouridine synthase n=1 Tax=Bifidobacterium pseudolongum subsp. globosum TaxID=1690 RepID=A0A4V1Y4L7_9BIFI|nr:cell division protein DivIVA [Bifidobacterium pseudolongum]MCH4843073.1 cell division protein DivIVA [Bifidobacterium pseudolongum]MCH4851823.1 cell division protein DivIVA [Bifidobacterium pseudolongum]RYQ35985.1 dihydrouridine synthase [Bifidobacterium pseudolongum subsp. globosum]
MVQHQEEADGTTTIARVGKRKKGYDVHQVDAFLEQAHALYEADGIQLHRSDIQDASFDIVKGGYAIPQVDAALERLEQAVTDKQTQYDIAQLGRVAWKAQTEAQFQELDRHAQRAEGQRFAPAQPKTPSYDRKQVDRLIDRVLAKAEAELERISAGSSGRQGPEADPTLTSPYVEDVSFTQRKGKHGYDERQVDYYLNACVNLLASLESYERIADYAAPAAHAAAPSAPVPLIAADQANPQTQHYGVTVESDLPARPADGETTVVAEAQPAQSFDELSRAEQEIFAQAQEARAAMPPSFAAQGVAAAVTAAPAVAQIDEGSATEVFTPITDTTADGDTAPASDVVKHAPTLSDIKPITPAPRTIPEHEKTASAMDDSMSTIPHITEISDETTIAAPSEPLRDLNSPSLAALASLAETTQTAPERENPAITSGVQPLAVPKLSSILPDLPPLQPLTAPATAATPEVPPAAQPTPSAAPTTAATPSAAPVHAPDEPATTDAEPANVAQPGDYPRFAPSDSIDIEIPDLSFPTISTDEPLIIDGKPNEKQA